MGKVHAPSGHVMSYRAKAYLALRMCHWEKLKPFSVN